MRNPLRPAVRSSIGFAISVLLFVIVGASNAVASPVFAPEYKAIPAGFDALPQWQRVMASASARPADTVAPWQELVAGLASEQPLRQLDTVNRYFNRIPYGADAKIYGAADYWATPEEFMQRNVGDCEDYSIAKYTALRALGWSAESLLIVVIRDHKHNVNHAVLAANLDGQWYYLDNRASRLLDPVEVPFYQPVYALNEQRLSVFVKSQPPLPTAAGQTPAGTAAARTG